MKKQTFWTEVSRYGAIIGALEVLFLLLGALFYGKTGLTMIFSVLHVAIFVTLLYLFTKRRSVLYGAEGYSFGDGMKFIFFLSLLAGVLAGAYDIVARNWLFPGLYREMADTMMAAMAQAKLSTKELLEVKESFDKTLFSPLYVVGSDVLGLALRGLFFGLFIAAFTRREANIFADKKEENE